MNELREEQLITGPGLDCDCDMPGSHRKSVNAFTLLETAALGLLVLFSGGCRQHDKGSPAEGDKVQVQQAERATSQKKIEEIIDQKVKSVQLPVYSSHDPKLGGLPELDIFDIMGQQCVNLVEKQKASSDGSFKGLLSIKDPDVRSALVTVTELDSRGGGATDRCEDDILKTDGKAALRMYEQLVLTEALFHYEEQLANLIGKLAQAADEAQPDTPQEQESRYKIDGSGRIATHRGAPSRKIAEEAQKLYEESIAPVPDGPRHCDETLDYFFSTQVSKDVGKRCAEIYNGIKERAGTSRWQGALDDAKEMIPGVGK